MDIRSAGDVVTKKPAKKSAKEKQQESSEAANLDSDKKSSEEKSAWDRLLELLREDALLDQKETLSKLINEDLENSCNSVGIDPKSVIILFDEAGSISTYHSNRIYRALGWKEQAGDINLIVESPGGLIEPAYLISKTCKRLAGGKFTVAVPRKAKSAATLISLGADEIHMGLMSELGPIDPQLNGIPAMALSNALSGIAELVCQFPGAEKMFAAYLAQKLDLRHLGFYQRINESAEQYAARLIGSRVLPNKATATSMANHFVNHYKDHGFVIDADEASGLLGPDYVKQNTMLYMCANMIYITLSLVSSVLKDRWSYSFRFVGAIGAEIDVEPV